MKKLFFLLFIATASQPLHAQLGPIELMAGDKYLHYQHSLGQSFKTESRFGWQHIATLIKRHNNAIDKGGMPDELMNQGYITYRLNRFLMIKGGLFYTNAGGYEPSLSLQFFLKSKSLVVVVAPRADVTKNGAYELFTAVEYGPAISSRLRLYSRIQAMSSITSEQHNRSYQLVRLGVDLKGFQFGAGLSLDEYGKSATVHYNTGVFIRKML